MSGTHGQQGWPTTPVGGRPTGPPPSGPPPQQPPTALPPSGPPSGPPQAPPPVPPGWGPPPPGWGPPPGPPPRKRRWPLFVGLAVVLLLLAGAGTGGWAYFTGRLGFGPLSAADKAAASAIADGVEAPEWVDAAQLDCAADDLIRDARSGELEKRGLVERDGDDWTYTGTWRTDDAEAFYESVLDCSDDWEKQVGEQWKIADTGCLDDIGSETMGSYFAASLVPDDPPTGRDEAVAKLDECYAEAPAAPQGQARSAYRAVQFTFTPPEASGGEVVLNTGGAGAWKPLSGTSAEVDTKAGGQRGCIQAQTQVTYGWGTVKTSEAELCGVAQPTRIFWKKTRCTASPGCRAWELRYEGFADLSRITARYTSNGGDCLAVSGRCSDTVLIAPGGRGKVVTWSFPGSYRGAFVATVGKLRTRLPN